MDKFRAINIDGLQPNKKRKTNSDEFNPVTGMFSTTLSLQKHTKYSPSISQPKMVGYFSIDKNLQYKADCSQCKYLKIPLGNQRFRWNLDLNEGYEKSIPKLLLDVKINNLLTFTLANLHVIKNDEEQQKRTNKLLKPDILCFRGVLKLLMATPYQNKEWIILATKYKGTIYLCRMDTEEDKKRVQNQSFKEKRIISYGFKFEQYLMTDDPNVSPDMTLPVNACEEFCCMFKINFDGKLNIWYGAEMDGIESKNKLDFSIIDWNLLEFVELKVLLEINKENRAVSFKKYRLLDWWCQSFLVGLQKIIYGLRTDEGIVFSIKELMIDEIPSIAKDYWKPGVCLNFCMNFLETVQNAMLEIDSATTVFKFVLDRQCNISYTKYENPENELRFLPDWYMHALS